MLFIVGTPIGNLEDLSIRQARIIASSDVILTEDTRSTGKLLERIKSSFSFDRNPNQRLISYYKEKEFEKLPEVLELIENNSNIVLISESGMPLISDPGSLLIKELIKRKIEFQVIPGPTAVITALVYSGFDLSKFTFLGFLPKKATQIRKILSTLQLSDLTTQVVFYESPNRINKTLEIIDQILPDSDIVICRELTKKFEEIVRGRARDLTLRQYKGEITVILRK